LQYNESKEGSIDCEASYEKQLRLNFLLRSVDSTVLIRVKISPGGVQHIYATESST